MRNGGLIRILVLLLVAAMFALLAPMAVRQTALQARYSVLVEVEALVRNRYVKSVSPNELLDAALQGMMTPLDVHSRFLNASELNALQDETEGRRSGVAIDVDRIGGRTLVVEIATDGHAAATRLSLGDAIISIDEQPVQSLPISNVRALLEGAAGHVRSFHVIDGQTGLDYFLDLPCEPIEVPTVRGLFRDASGKWAYLLDDENGIIYVRITSFGQRTVEEFDTIIDNLRLNGIRGLILDMRFNHGGLLSQGAALANRFLDTGLIVETISREKATKEFFASSEHTLPSWPVVVLVNGETASAAEIVTGSLQCHGRATVIGESTYGKGSVQELIPLLDHPGALRLTVAYYRLPDGRYVDRAFHQPAGSEWGIQPDVTVHPAFPADRNEGIEDRSIPSLTLGVVPHQDTQLQAAMNHLVRKLTDVPTAAAAATSFSLTRCP